MVSVRFIDSRLVGLMVIWLLLPGQASTDSIREAVARGDLAAVQTFVKADPGVVNSRMRPGEVDGWEVGATPLHAAARNGRLDVAKLLLANGADINAQRRDGESALGEAAFNDRLEVAALLIQSGSKMNLPGQDGCTPLHWAAERGSAAMVNLLVAGGADVKARRTDGGTPLQRGLAANKAETVDALLRSVRVDRSFDHTQLATVVQQLGAVANIAFTADTPLLGTVTRELKAVPLTVALRILLHDAEGGPLLYDLRDGALHIRSATLFTNGGLEQNDGKKAVGFDLNTSGVALATDAAHTGRYSVRVICDGLHDCIFHTTTFPLPQPRDRRQRILVHAWIKARNLQIFHQGGWSAGRVAVWAHDANGRRIKTLNPNGWDNVGLGEFAGYFCGTFDWREVRGNFVVPAGTASLSIEAGMSWAKRTAWFDDFSVEEVPLVWEPAEEAEGGKDADGTSRVHAATLTGAGGVYTILLVNDGAQSKTVHLTGSQRQRLYHTWYDSTLPDGLQRGTEIVPGETTVLLKP